jgi:hypothetical protein
VGKGAAVGAGLLVAGCGRSAGSDDLGAAWGTGRGASAPKVAIPFLLLLLLGSGLAVSAGLASGFAAGAAAAGFGSVLSSCFSSVLTSCLGSGLGSSFGAAAAAGAAGVASAARAT